MEKYFQDRTVVISGQDAKQLGINEKTWHNLTINGQPLEPELVDSTMPKWNLPLIFIKIDAYLNNENTNVNLTKWTNFEQLGSINFIEMVAAQKTIQEMGLDYDKMFELFYANQPVKRPFDSVKYETVCAKYESKIPHSDVKKIEILHELQETIISLHSDYLLNLKDQDLNQQIQKYADRLCQIMEQIGIRTPKKEK